MEKKDKQTTVIIRLSHRRMLYDIANNAFVVGLSESGERRQWVHDIVEGQNADRVERVLWMAFCRLRDKLAGCRRIDRVETTPGDRMTHPWDVETRLAGGDKSDHHSREYLIKMTMRGEVRKAKADYWGVLCYEYMTATAIADWLEMTAPEQAPCWKTKGEMAWEALMDSVVNIGGQGRRALPVI